MDEEVDVYVGWNVGRFGICFQDCVADGHGYGVAILPCYELLRFYGVRALDIVCNNGTSVGRYVYVHDDKSATSPYAALASAIGRAVEGTAV